MKRKKKRSFIIFAMIVMFFANSLQVSANSMPAYWEAVALEGVTFYEENCPIEVKSERLIFNIKDFLKEDYRSIEAFQKYGSTVSAEYTFYNPTNTDITAKLMFPMGQLPDNALYIEMEDNIWQYDLDKYSIWADDKVVEKDVRHMYMGENAVFDAKKALGEIKNDYVGDDFFSPDLPVTQYTYKVENLNEDEWYYLDADMAVPDEQENTRYLFPHINVLGTRNGKRYVNDTLFSDESYIIYVFGENKEPVIDVELREYEETEKTEGRLVIDETQSMTFAEFVQLQNDERYQISEIDWYNIAVTLMNKNVAGEDLIQGSEYMSQDLYTRLIRWYEYEVSISAKETITNTVTAPIYPAYDQVEAPNRYKYIYYLSPAKEWRKFGDFTVEIHSPFYLNTSNIGEFEKTAEGYRYERDGLPDSELEFVMSKTSDPDNERIPFDIGEFFYWMITFISIFILDIPLIPGVVIIGVIIYIIKRKRRKKKI